ncbi:hypothetical protein NBRC116188_13030 [Oceaniserpentilla sp. 4NH20-0058]|uniref:hypothetical protein n=1 Tax=Oceaniserpentilla sp. 4NH20-0058 TaxID=3127660 RepID=UPI00310BF52E
MYTFIHPNHVPFLKQLRLVFNGIDDLNDPFIENKRVHRPVSQQPLSDSEFSAAMGKNYESLEPHIKSMVTFEYYLEQASQNRAQIEQQLNQQALASQVQSSVAVKAVYEKVGFIRLFDNIHQQGLWESVGCQHQCIAIKLDPSHEYFSHTSFNQKPQIFEALEYDDSRPAAPCKENPFPALFRRPEHFAYERERRLVRPVSALDQNKEGVVYSRLPKGVIKGIYLGLGCAPSVIDTMHSLVTHDLQFRGVGLKQLGVSETHLRLVATTIK